MNNAIEQEILDKGLTAPRITPQDIDNTIASAEYHVFPGTSLTVCCLTLRNGFTVTGESATASPENFDVEIGKKIARSNAREKIWALEGYLLKDRLWSDSKLCAHSCSTIAEETENVTVAARVAHEANRAYCQAIGVDSQLPWDDAPQWQRGAINGVRFHRANFGATPENSHESWLAEKVANGWE